MPTAEVHPFQMLLTYTTSEKDFVRAATLMLRKKSGATLAVSWMGGMVLAYILFSAATSAAFRASLLAASPVRLILGIWGPLFMVALPILIRRGIRKQFRSNPKIAETRTLQADVSGIRLRSASTSSEAAWTVYSAFAEDGHNFVLVQRGATVGVPVPKRELTQDQIDQFRMVLKSRPRAL